MSHAQWHARCLPTNRTVIFFRQLTDLTARLFISTVFMVTRLPAKISARNLPDEWDSHGYD